VKLFGHGGDGEVRFLGSRRRAAVVGAVLLAVVGVGGAVTSSAEAATSPTNHVYISFHGMPTYTWTISKYDKSGKEVYNEHQTCVGGCKRSFDYDPGTIDHVYVHINSGTEIFWDTFRSSTEAGYDHCILVKAGGKVVYTGDETQGCNGK
jgi:hypothetical protein